MLSHLLFLVGEANVGNSKKNSIIEFYRPVAIDLLAVYDVTENSEVHRFASDIAR